MSLIRRTTHDGSKKIVARSGVTRLTQISEIAGGTWTVHLPRASVKRQVAPVARESRLKVDGPKEPAHLVGKILF
jgi:hypothetical protein